MSHHALLEYIRQARDIGASDHEIAERLHGVGWYHVDVQDALELYSKITEPVLASTVSMTMPEVRPSNTAAPRTYDPHIIAVACLSFALGFIGYLWLVR